METTFKSNNFSDPIMTANYEDKNALTKGIKRRTSIGGGLGLIFGIVFGVVFSVVCIVFLVKALGRSAEWVLDTLLYGGNDLMEITKQQILIFFGHPPSHQD
ncbi:hypothetical protein GLOIN_2v1779652 [Rhizophagus irregularis DAOM 181602=DAOM 197198]|nr:hypothetical protein GLOIN_2v1779652 [Rhizophagus irregularis DAOM 181602=DAOM 197198]